MSEESEAERMLRLQREAQAQRGKQPMSKGAKIGLGVLGGVLVLAVLGSLLPDDKKSTAQPTPAESVAADAAPDLPEKVADAASSQEDQEPPAPVLTGPQANAVRSAQQYLSISGFSRKGLIQQLSSGAGDGYDVADATAAVDSLNVDWNEQAARSAKQYLEISGFSCKGLIQQLSSSAGDDYTVSEATYGAKQAGAC